MGAPLVGLAAERLFGFRGALGDSSSGAGGKVDGSTWLLVCTLSSAGRLICFARPAHQRHADGKNVAALSSALLVCMVVPWVLCLLFFTGR